MQPQAVNTSIDLTGIIIALITALIPAIGSVAVYLINKRMKDAQLRTVADNLIERGLGVVQQTASGVVYHVQPHLDGVVPAYWAPGVQYVLDYGAEVIKRWPKDYTPPDIANKLIARNGTKAIETNLAATASSATPTVVPPLAPSVPATTPIPDAAAAAPHIIVQPGAAV